MLRLHAWAMGVALVWTVLAPALSAQEPSGDLRWYHRMLGHGHRTMPTPSKSSKAATKSSSRPPRTPRISPREQAAQTLTVQQQSFLKRLNVLNRFKLIALRTGDEDLMEQAEKLERQATELYERKIAHLPSSRLKPVLPTTAEATDLPLPIAEPTEQVAPMHSASDKESQP